MIALIKAKKVKFFDRNILKKFGAIISIISAALTILLAFFKIPYSAKTWTGTIFIIVLIVSYIGFWFWSNKVKSISIKIGVTSVEIKTGDIFEQGSLKAIAFNEYFDTQVDDRIIAKKSLNGQVIEKCFSDVIKLDAIIENDQNLQAHICEKNVKRNGKGTRYKLGSSIEVNDFILTAFTRFNDKNEAQLTVQEYVDFLLSFWNEVNRLYAQRSVTVPVFGSGITRFKNGFEDININELLKIMIWTFKVSKIKVVYPAKLTIIIRESRINEVNLFEIKENE